MSGLVADTSIWIEFFAGREALALETALADGLVVLPPIVVAELLSGARSTKHRKAVRELLGELPLHDTPRSHWLLVGELRRSLAEKGLTVSTPDAHVAQCALDREAPLLSRDQVFVRIAELTPLRLGG